MKLRLAYFTALASLAPLATGCRTEAGVSDLVSDLPHGQTLLGTWQKSTEPRCTAAAPATTSSEGTGSSAGHVVFRLPNGHDYRIEARPGAKPEDLTHELDGFSPGEDGFVNASADGQWLLVQTTRFGCGKDMCIAIVDRNACSAQVIVAGRAPVHPGATSAIGRKGEVVVFPAQGTHATDLFAVKRAGDGWSDPVNLTAASPAPHNKQPSLSADGTKVAFDCGPEPGEAPGTAICEVGTDGKDFRVAVAANAHPGQISGNHHPSYGPDGSIAFEGTWNDGAEQIWRASPGKEPELVNKEEDQDGKFRFSNDNSPCVLPDGRVVSLWLGRDTGAKTSGHELKIMNADGAEATMLIAGVDVVDIGIGCTH